MSAAAVVAISLMGTGGPPEDPDPVGATVICILVFAFVIGLGALCNSCGS